MLYVGGDLATSACEVFGEAEEALICPRWRVAAVALRGEFTLFDLVAEGSALQITALPQLADGDLDRALTQEWARAIYEDDPLGEHADGLVYRSGYNGGLSVVLWDSEGRLDIVEDRALAEAELYGQLIVDMEPRHIRVEKVQSPACRRCINDPRPP